MEGIDPVDLFSRGGPVMYAIALGSVVGLAVFLERMWSLQRQKVVPRALLERVEQLVSSGEIDKALTICEENRTSIAIILRAVLKRPGAPLPVVKEAVEEAGRQQAARLERFVAALGTVASISPLLGLLGTVTGIISVFQRVAETGVGSPLEMAAGIWEALITTAFGLGVAIPALLSHRYTLGRVDGLVLELEEEALRMVELVGASKEPSTTTASADANADADANAGADANANADG